MMNHLCIKIDDELARIKKKGTTVLVASPHEAMKELCKARAEGKEYFSGCENMKENGMCAGHPDET